MMKVKLLRDILVGPSDTMPTLKGTVVDMPDDQAKQYIVLGHGEEAKAQKEPEPVKRGRK